MAGEGGVNQNVQKSFLATAFVSCSLRQEDKLFVDFVERILKKHRIRPFGTVGLYSAAPVNTAELMRTNIPKADLIVIAATPRYLQKDLQTGQQSSGLSEMLHVESGIAYASNKPIVVFAKDGTNVGNFLPKVTQYVVLNGQQQDLQQKWRLINNLLNNAYKSAKHIQDEQSLADIGKLAVGGLAFWGALKLFEELTTEDQ